MGKDRACDACAFRRVRCDNMKPACTNCSRRSLRCEHTRPVQKRGPTGSRIERLRTMETSSPGQAAPPLLHSLPRASTSQVTLEDSNGLGLFDPSFLSNASWLQKPEGGQMDSYSDMLPSVSGSLLASLALPNLSNEANLAFSPPSEQSPSSQQTFSTSYGLEATPSFGVTGLEPFAVSHLAPSSILSADEQERLLNEFFVALAPTIPVFSKSYIFGRLADGETQRNIDFAALILSMCGVVQIQPLAAAELADEQRAEAKRQLAIHLIDEVSKMRARSDLGEHPDLDSIMTSFFLFACLFGLQMYGAAWMRLQEAVNLAQLLGIDDPKTYVGLEKSERERRKRAFCSLAITERAFAVQHRHQTAFKGQISYPDDLNGGQEGDLFLQRHMRLFDAVDSRFLLCWSGNCLGGRRCTAQNVADALALDRRLASETPALVEEDETTSASIQHVDLNLTQLWLRNRLYTLCLDHELVSFDTQTPGLDGMLAFHIARNAADLGQSRPMSILEALGLSFAEKLFDIAEALATLTSVEPMPEPLKALGGRSAVLQLLARYAVLLTSFRAGRTKYAAMIKSLYERARDARKSASEA